MFVSANIIVLVGEKEAPKLKGISRGADCIVYDRVKKIRLDLDNVNYEHIGANYDYVMFEPRVDAIP